MKTKRKKYVSPSKKRLVSLLPHKIMIDGKYWYLSGQGSKAEMVKRKKELMLKGKKVRTRSYKQKSGKIIYSVFTK